MQFKIQNRLDELQPNYSLSTINKVYLFLHSMIKHGKEEKDFPESYNPFATVELPDETAVGKKPRRYRYFRQNVLNGLRKSLWDIILTALSHTIMGQRWLYRILKRIGEKHYGTHAVRHTFATRLLSKTSSHQKIKAVAELLGDDYKVVVKTHLHTDEDGKHNLVDMLNDQVLHLATTL